MLNIQEVVNFLNEHLNTDEKISINVKAEIGESDKESLINGILRTANSKTTPIANYVENRYTFVVELSVPTGRSNKVFLKTQNIVSGFVDSYDGTKVEFTDGNGTINCSLGKPETFKVAYNVGDCTPLYFTIDMIYTESGVMSVDKKWYLSDDGTNFYEIPYESESVVLNKEGITRKVDFDKFTKTYLTGQTKFYKFKFPYQDTTLGNMLMKDILNGDFKKQYTIKYTDGINYTSDDLTKPPFTSKVSIYMSGDINSQVVSVGKFDITFTDVDDGNTTTKYYIGLINWQFDLSGEDTRWFASQSDQQTYFEGKVTGTGGTGWQQIEAPNLNSIYITNQVFPNSATTKLNVFDLVRKNYAIIKISTTENNVTTSQYIYYGATNPQIGANGQVTYDLEEDTIQTILPNAGLSIADSFIERCHQSRFVQKGDNSGDYVFDWQYTSPLFEREPLQGYSGRPVEKRKLKVAYDTNGRGSTFSTWMNTHVSHWVYVYLSYTPDLKYKWAKLNVTPALYEEKALPEIVYTKEGVEPWVQGGVVCLCYPIYKDGLSRITTNTATGLNLGDIGSFLTQNKLYSYVVAIKNSIMPPFNIRSMVAGTDYEIADTEGVSYLMTLKGMTVYKVDETSSISEDWGCAFIKTGDTGKNSVLLKRYQKIDDGCPLYLDTNMFQNTFTAAETRTTTVEPKLYNEDYSIYHIYFGGQTYDMPISKTSNLPGFMYYEPLTPDITKFYLAYDRDSDYTNDEFGGNSVFNDNSKKDYTGLVGCLDLSMWFYSDKLNEWLATNKNNLQIFQNNQNLSRTQAGQNLASTAVNAFTGAVKQTAVGALGGAIAGGGVLGAAAGAMGGAISGTVSGIGSMIGGINNYFANEQVLANERINRDLTIDNMRQSPASLSALNSNSILIQNVDDFGIYLELQAPLPYEQKQIKDYLKKYGYTVNRIGSIKNYLETTSGGSKVLVRNKYVYIKALISAMSGIPMSTQERLNFKQRFENGIRFWNYDSVDYSVINYENRLYNIG